MAFHISIMFTDIININMIFDIVL
ncbi:uncharacterized protein METZ01_LOCUS348515 [marine metagenome]|uniref:Uncharacterized protein n=1 Tax=marine metagenome TaxID=408172 RepID=A0A382RGD7_9ZZZZ